MTIMNKINDIVNLYQAHGIEVSAIYLGRKEYTQLLTEHFVNNQPGYHTFQIYTPYGIVDIYNIHIPSHFNVGIAEPVANLPKEDEEQSLLNRVLEIQLEKKKEK